jgi:hypothetical protein
VRLPYQMPNSENVVGIATMLRAERSGIRIPVGRGMKCLSSLTLSDRLCGPQSLLFRGNRGCSGRGVKLATHLHLLPRLRMSGAIPLPPYMPSQNRHVRCDVASGHSSTAGLVVLPHSILTLAVDAGEEEIIQV